MPVVDLETWNRYIGQHPTVHLLQTGVWGELKQKFGWKPIHIIEDGIGIQLLFKKLPFGFSVGYSPRTSVEAVESLIGGNLGQVVDRVCKKNWAIFLKIEPDCWALDRRFESKNYRLSNHAIQPLSTIEVDITGSEDEILGGMKQKCRYNIRLAEKKEIIVRESGNVNEFYELMQETGGRDGFEVHSREYYKTAYHLAKTADMMTLFVAEYDGAPLASLMVFAVGSRSWYLYGASSDRERNRMPAYLLQWKAIQWAKEKGCKTYDLWGIPDEMEAILERDFEKRHDGLWGVYRFKRGFGGMVKRAHPPLDRIYSKILYMVYAIRQKLRGIPES
jgi:lipid II:glycine glycyltransferase (peptidoglycan interpeptide bridge formation enzyme)